MVAAIAAFTPGPSIPARADGNGPALCRQHPPVPRRAGRFRRLGRNQGGTIRHHVPLSRGAALRDDPGPAARPAGPRMLAYAYTNLLSHPGPVQSAAGAVTGWGPRRLLVSQYPLAARRALMLVCVLYPYVHLLWRGPPSPQQSANAYLAARTSARALGRSGGSALPMARPAIAAGLLAVMETIATMGTVAHFGVRTFDRHLPKPGSR